MIVKLKSRKYKSSQVCLKHTTDEMWGIIFKMLFQSFVFEWLHHICSAVNALHNTCDRFATLIEVYIQSLPRVYIGISNVFTKEKKSRITVSVFRLVRQLGSLSGPVFELKRILSSKRCNSAWIKLIPEAFSWYVITNFFWRKK